MPTASSLMAKPPVDSHKNVCYTCCMPSDKEYMRKYMLNRYHKRRNEWLRKLGGKCAMCSATDVLEFDHVIAASKEHNIGKILASGSNKLVAYEMAKCQLLCHDCHVEKSQNSNDVRVVPHGGGVSGKRNCSCDLCRSKKNEYANNRRKRLRAVS